jgi:hypothetical protein
MAGGETLEVQVFPQNADENLALHAYFRVTRKAEYMSCWQVLSEAHYNEEGTWAGLCVF